MITARQIRAARGLLAWSGEQLAEKAGLTRPAISNIESEKVNPNDSSLASIAAVFDLNGVEFLDGDGVKLRQQEVRTYSGKDGYRALLDHIYATLKRGGRIRQFFLNDNYGPSFADEYGKAHIARMAQVDDLDGKVLTIEGDWEFPATSYCTYRWIGKADADFAPFYLYGDNIVLPMFESTHKREWVSINSKMMAERYAKQFDAAWARAVVPKKAKGK
jgi:transcriptional regulator with XRE-family HTH domain